MLATPNERSRAKLAPTGRGTVYLLGFAPNWLKPTQSFIQVDWDVKIPLLSSALPNLRTNVLHHRRVEDLDLGPQMLTANFN